MQPQVIAGRYEVVRAIGSGGMGTVWLARDTVLGREVAVKRIGALPGDPAAAARAMREARIAASLHDTHTVGVFDVVDEDDAHWLVMEFVNGQSLAEQIRDEGALPPTRVAAIGAAVAGALARAHERGIVHRDVKPGNILIDQAGTPKISDFGIARATADDQLTQTGFMTGTPSYLSPELARGGNPTSGSDVWALGATLYSAVEGQPAFASEPNPLATLQNIAAGDARPMQLAGPLSGAIAAMMERDPERRWDMATAAERLGDISRGDTTLAMPAGAVPAAAAATELIPEPVESTQRVEPLVVPPPAYDRDPEPARDERDDERRTSPWVPIFIVLVLAALLAAGWALWTANNDNTPTTTPTGRTITETATQTQTVTPSSSSSTTSTTSSPTSSPTTTEASPQDNARLERFVKNYYGDVTDEDKRDDTFAQLTPAMQEKSGGRDGYEDFWSTIKSVDVGEARADAAAGTVILELTFKPEEGGDSKEVHTLTMVRDGDSWLIDNDAKS